MTLAQVFLCDVAVTARTAFVSEAGNLVTALPAIRRRYLGSWLVPDLLGALPLDVIPLLATHAAVGSSLRASLAASVVGRGWWRGLLLLRLLRLSKYLRYQNEFVQHFGHTDSDGRRLTVGILVGLALLSTGSAASVPRPPYNPARRNPAPTLRRPLALEPRRVRAAAGLTLPASLTRATWGQTTPRGW